MTLPKNVKDAVKELDAVHDQRFAPWRGQWQTIRAHLMSQEAEVERLRESTHYANGVADLAMKHRDLAESGLAAANAILQKVYVWGENMDLHEQIRVHLGMPE